MKRSLFSVALALALSAGCGGGRRPLLAEDARILKVKITAAGDVYLDGQAATVDAAMQELKRLKSERGAVLYYREEANGQPHPNSLKIIHRIEELKLPVGISEKDFE